MSRNPDPPSFSVFDRDAAAVSVETQQLQAAIDKHRAGRLAEAIPVYEQVLAVNPGEPVALHHLGLAKAQNLDVPGGLALIERALANAPDYAEAHHNRALLLRQMDRAEEALEALRRAVALRPGYAEARANLGAMLIQLGRLDEAETVLHEATTLCPDFAEAHNIQGALRKLRGDLPGAAVSFRRALALAPDHVGAHYNLGGALFDAGSLDEAEAAYRQCLARQPDYAEAHNNLGNVLKARGDHTAAIDAYQASLRLRPNSAETQVNLGKLLHEQGRPGEAIVAYRAALAADPNLAAAHSGLGMSLLQCGDFEQGWRAYEWRWQTRGFADDVLQFTQPLWTGEALNGETILLYAEQGLGDTLQFVRYAPIVAWMGARVVVECDARLAPLIATMEGVNDVITHGATRPPHACYAPLLSLPRILDTTLESLPDAVPYLTVPAAAELPIDAADDNLKVGIVWAGSLRTAASQAKACDVADFARLARLPGVTFYSLQFGEPAAALADLGPDTPIRDLGPAVADFTGSAAAVMQLDLIITVDTAMAHLAGALGRPVWTLLHDTAEWRWLLEREDSPWYPSMRLFRQRAPGDWAEVFTRVEAALAGLAQERQ